MSDNDCNRPPPELTYAERQRLFVLSGNPRRSSAEEAEYADLKARADAIVRWVKAMGK